MKLERLHESVLPFIVLLGGLLLAIYAGSMAGSGKTGTIGMIVAGIAAVAFFLIVRERVWMLIPATWILAGKISVLPLPFSIAQVCVMFAFGTFLLLKAFKVIRRKPKVGIVDVWVLVALAYLVTVFLRNPVGVEALGSDRVGGKPYFEVAVACCAYWVLARSVMSPREAFWVPFLSIAGYTFDTLLNAIAYAFPSTIEPLSQLYSGISAAENPDALNTLPGEGSNRQAYLGGLGSSLFNYACARWRPFTIINPIFFGRFFLFLISSFLVLQSGFRSALFGMMLVFLTATYFRRGIVETSRALLIGLFLLALLIAMQGTLINLPLPAQRALSFLPGKWDYMAKSEAQGSTEWRVEMWKQMLSTDRYIANKWLGDGFGFTRRQLEVMNANLRLGSNADQQENLMISGGVHSGPVSAIRYVGYVGLAIHLILLSLMAIEGARVIRRSQDTPFYTLALLAGIPLVLHPFTFVLIFGSYGEDLGNCLVSFGILKVIENSLDAYVAPPKEARTPIQSQPTFRRPPQFASASRIS